MTTLATLTDPRLAKWMRYASKPQTFEAYAEFVEGIELHTNGKLGEAIPYFLRAEALDSDFTMASLWASAAYHNSGRRAPGDSILQALNGRRGQLAPLDRLFLDYGLAYRREDPHSALEAMRRFVEIAPGSEFLWKAGDAALWLGRPGEAIEFLMRADPESGWLRGFLPYWSTLIRAYHAVGDYERELEALDRMLQLHPEMSQTALGEELDILAASGRIEELGARIPRVLQRVPWRTPGWFGELRAHGYPAAASDLMDRTLEWFEGRTSDWRREPGQSYVYAKLLSQAGRWDEAQAVLEDILLSSSQRQHDTALELAYVLARQGQRDQAFRAVGLTRLPNDLVVRAWVEAALGERERAMELLREAGYETDAHGLATNHKMDSLRDYPPFLEEFIRPTG